MGLQAHLVLDAQEDEVVRLARFFKSVGLPYRLHHVGMDPQDGGALHTVALKALADGESTHNMPQQLNADMIVAAFLRADELGRHVEEEGA